MTSNANVEEGRNLLHHVYIDRKFPQVSYTRDAWHCNPLSVLPLLLHPVYQAHF
jgi:hypothetical protein